MLKRCALSGQAVTKKAFRVLSSFYSGLKEDISSGFLVMCFLARKKYTIPVILLKDRNPSVHMTFSGILIFFDPCISSSDITTKAANMIDPAKATSLSNPTAVCVIFRAANGNIVA